MSDVKSIENKDKKKENNKSFIFLYGIFLIAIIVFVGLSICFYRSAIRKGAKAAKDAYISGFNTEKEEVYKEFYQNFYDRAEEKYHVSNVVEISIGDVEEIEKLEVLTVRDTEYVINNEEEDGCKVWLEVPCEGDFVVDLKAAEFVKDNINKHIIVRLPSPEITNSVIDYDKIDTLLFKNNEFLKNGSYKKGEEIADKMTKDAQLMMQKKIASNQNFYVKAEDSAKTAIECLIRKFNPEIPDLKVEVEFY